jgi:hypothetical protein
MTVSLATVKDQLPAAAPKAWPKPMAAEGYTPSNAGFHVVFAASADGSESFSSKLVADRVSSDCSWAPPLRARCRRRTEPVSTRNRPRSALGHRAPRRRRR